MSTFAKVLLATDLSQQSANLTKCLTSLCPDRETEIVLAHVLDEDEDADPQASDFHEVSEHLRSCKEDLLAAGYTAVSTITPVGDEPEEMLNRVADELDVDLLLVASHEKNFFQRALMGSTSCELAEIATVPVFINDDDGDDRDNLLERVLVATDFSRQSLEALNIIRALREHIGEVHFLHVIEHSRSKEDYKEQQANAKLFLEELVEELKLFGVEADYCIAKGVASKQIRQVCSEKNINLLVIAKTGAGQASEQGIGSTAQNVVENAGCAILLLPGETYDD